MTRSQTSRRRSPFYFAVGGALVACYCAGYIEPFPKELAVSTLTLGVVTAGFTATKRSMLLSMGGSRVLKFAKSSGYGKVLLDYFGQGIYGGFSLILVSAIRLLMPSDLMPHPTLWMLWFAFFSASLVFTIAALVRNERIMALAIRVLDGWRNPARSSAPHPRPETRSSRTGRAPPPPHVIKMTFHAMRGFRNKVFPAS